MSGETTGLPAHTGMQPGGYETVMPVGADRTIPPFVRKKLRQLFGVEDALGSRRRGLSEQIAARKRELVPVRRAIGELEAGLDRAGFNIRGQRGDDKVAAERQRDKTSDDLKHLKEREAEIKAEVDSLEAQLKRANEEFGAINVFVEHMEKAIPGGMQLHENWRRTGDAGLAVHGFNIAR